MTTGQWLYRRKSELETLKAVVESDAPLPSRIHPGYPRELEQIVMKTLTRKREDRWQTAGDLADALTEFGQRQRLNLAPVMLGRMMTQLFAEDVAAWQDARRAGSTLGDHLVAELEREERKAAASRKIPNDTGRGSVSGTADTALGKRITVDDFDSPTVDHSPEELGLSDNGGMEDEPTTVHTPQRPSPWGQLTPPTPSRSSRPTPTPTRPPPPGSSPPAAPSAPDPRQRPSGRRVKSTELVRTTPTSVPVPAEPEPSIEDLSPTRLVSGWTWLAIGGAVAVIAAIWFVVSLLRGSPDPNLPTVPPVFIPSRPTEAAAPPVMPPPPAPLPTPTQEPVIKPPAAASAPRPGTLPAGTTTQAAGGVAAPPTAVKPRKPARPAPAKVPPVTDTATEAKPVEPAPAPAPHEAGSGSAGQHDAPEPSAPTKPSP